VDGPDRGALAITSYGCGSCHTIAGIAGAHGLVGPSLTGIRARVYIAGSLDNNPSNLERWIEDPQAVKKHTAMPNLGVTPQDAGDITQYLYSLQ
jgi:cytochrome c